MFLKKVPFNAAAIAILMAAVVHCLMNKANAQETSSYWIGPEGGNWSDTVNWNNGIPTLTTDAYLNNDNTAIITQTGEYCRGLFLSGKLWVQGGSLVVDQDWVVDGGNGSLRITDGGYTQINTFIRPFGGVPTISVDGINSKLDVYLATRLGSGSMMISNCGQVNSYELNISSGILKIESGGTHNGYSTSMGNFSGYDGEIVVDGAFSKFQNKQLTIGTNGGTGSMTISGGGQAISSSYSYLGVHPGSSATVTVDGADSKWSNSQYLYLGASGSSTLNITKGGQVTSKTCILGQFAGSQSTVSVSGQDSMFIAESLDIGGRNSTGGVSSLTVADGGQTNVSGTLRIWQPNNSANVNGGTLSVGSLVGNVGSISITDPASAIALTIGSSTNSTFGGTITDNLGPGSLKKIGTGTLTLAGSNTFTGSTLVAEGQLALTGAATLGSSVIDVSSGAKFDVSALANGYMLAANQTLKGSGTILGNLTVNGIHAPGNSPGIETVLGDYNVLGELQIELKGTSVGTGYDQVLLGANGAASYNAALGGLLALDWTGMNGSTDTTKLWILKNDTAGTLSGQFSNYANGASLGLHEGRNWFIWYGADAATGSLIGGNDVVLAAVPEPAAIALLGLAACGWLFASLYCKRSKT